MRYVLTIAAIVLISATPFTELPKCEGMQVSWFDYEHPVKPEVYPDIGCRPGTRPVWTESVVYCE